jgi:transcriptional regulator with XRE-family HTH domain
MARTKPLLPEDLRYKDEFTKRLNDEYKKHAGSDAAFAAKLDVTRQALKKYLNGEVMPGLRTVALAYVNLGINVSYGKFDAKLLCSRGKSNKRSVEAQLLLPFAIESLSQDDVQIELVDKKKNRIEMSVTIQFANRTA